MHRNGIRNINLECCILVNSVRRRQLFDVTQSRCVPEPYGTGSAPSLSSTVPSSPKESQTPSEVPGQFLLHTWSAGSVACRPYESHAVLSVCTRLGGIGGQNWGPKVSYRAVRTLERRAGARRCLRGAATWPASASEHSPTTARHDSANDCVLPVHHRCRRFHWRGTSAQSTILV